MEADLLQYYRVDLADHWRGQLTLRRLWVLISQLPPESRVATELGGPGWRAGDYVIADVFGAVTGELHPTLEELKRARAREKRRGIANRLRAQQERLAAQKTEE